MKESSEGAGWTRCAAKRVWLILLCAPVVFASTNNCPHATSTQFATTVPGPAGGSPDNTLTAINGINGAGLGCTAVDLVFNNFSVSSAVYNHATADSTYLYVSPSGTYNPVTTPTVITMA